MWPLVFVIISSHIVSGVLTRQNLTLSDVSTGRNTGFPYYGNSYYDSHGSASDISSSSYYTPMMHYHHYDAPKYQQSHTGELCTWGRSFIDHILQIAVAKMSLLGFLKAAITAVGAGFITKLPIILFKLIALPVGLIVLGLPLLLPFLLPLLAMFIPIPVISHNSQNSEECNSPECEASRNRNSTRNVEERISKALKTFMGSEACIGRLACELGKLNSASEYKEPILWLLGQMQRSAPAREQGMISAYRTAYRRGNEGNGCNGGFYRCDVSRLVSDIYNDNET